MNRINDKVLIEVKNKLLIEDDYIHLTHETGVALKKIVPNLILWNVHEIEPIYHGEYFPSYSKKVWESMDKPQVEESIKNEINSFKNNKLEFEGSKVTKLLPFEAQKNILIDHLKEIAPSGDSIIDPDSAIIEFNSNVRAGRKV